MHFHSGVSMMSDLKEMADGHRQSFARAVSRWADGDELQFRVTPGATNYGSIDQWHPMERPEFHPNFSYRTVGEVEKLNIMAAIHEGYDD